MAFSFMPMGNVMENRSERVPSVHTSPEEFVKRDFTLTTDQIFSVHNTPVERYLANSAFFKSLRFEERFRKALFWCRMSVDSRPDPT